MFRYFTFLLAGIFAASAADASTIQSTTTGAGFNTQSWRNGRAGSLNNTPGPWFDRSSGDGSTCNIGYYIQGTSTGCSNQPGGIDRFSGSNYNGPNADQYSTHGLDFWTAGTALTADLNFNFAPDSPVFTVTLMAEAAAAYASYKLGFFVIGASGARIDYTLFAGSVPIGTQVTFSPGGNSWGFWMTGNGSTFYTTSSYNTTDTGTQHFAVFRDPQGDQTGNNWEKLWIGAEDASGAANGDWNDMIFTLTCGQCGTGVDPNGPYVVPESGTGTLAGIGVALVLLSRLRRKL
jgi:hypothetical protein